MTFSATEAAFEGLRVIRRRPSAVLLWGLLNLVIVGVVLAVILGGLLPLGAFEDEPDPAAVEAALMRTWPLMLMALPILILLGVVFYAAVYRAVLEPGESRAAFLRLGRAELRLLLAYLVVMLLWFGFVALYVLAVMAVGAVTPEGVRWIPVTLLILGGICLAVWLAVRLSLVLPIAFVEGGVPIGRSWMATRGRFWPLFGAYLLAFVFTIVVGAVAYVLGMIVLLVFGGVGLLSQMDAPDPSVFTPMLIIAAVLYLLIQVASAVLQAVVLNAPAASIYRQLRHAPAAPAA